MSDCGDVRDLTITPRGLWEGRYVADRRDDELIVDCPIHGEIGVVRAGGAGEYDRCLKLYKKHRKAMARQR